ncbi:hypothetical protein WJX74_003691 [Apatococcus lobatus]|uniref:Uncharacterized protein n=1 Tax=Apatococcus lobatus TaxID=904363 RepID=A0AAW1RWD2_9CHLO
MRYSRCSGRQAAECPEHGIKQGSGSKLHHLSLHTCCPDNLRVSMMCWLQHCHSPSVKEHANVPSEGRVEMCGDGRCCGE